MEYFGYRSPFSIIEAQFDEKTVLPFVQKYWHWCFYISAFYAFAVLFGQWYMKDRKPFNLRTGLCVWSAALSAFSFWALWRVSYELYHIFHVGGIQHAICDSRAFVGSTGNGIWTFMFAFSKLPELGDTVFIVLRKQKLSFLHVYHHISVMIFCWYSYQDPVSTGIWFGAVNYAVHAIMYLYYTVRASGRRPPRWVARSVTTIQISQMFIGLLINYVAGRSLLIGKQCQTNWYSISLSLGMYVSYIILFGNFYYWTYIYKRSAAPPKVTVAEKSLSTGVTKSNGHLNGVLHNGSVHKRH